MQHSRLRCWLLMMLVWGSPAAILAKQPLVSAAASLRDVLGEIARGTSDSMPVQFNFAGTGALELQIRQGAKVDLFIGAAPENLRHLTAEGLLTTASLRVWCRNQMALLVMPQITGEVAFDPQQPDWRKLRERAIRRIAIGEPRSVPAGRYAKELLEAQGLWDELAPKLIYAENVRQALAWVDRGEVDAALVYATDARVAKSARQVGLAPPDAPRIEYALALSPEGAENPAALRFYQYLLGAEGIAALERNGFLPPR